MPSDTATVATVADYPAAFAAFKLRRYAGRFRHEQAVWAAEMFLTEWGAMAAELEWAPDDIFALPHRGKTGLAYWLGTELITALGPEHAVTEPGRVFDRATRGQLLLMEALGTREPEFIDGFLGQLADVATKGRAVDERGLNFMLSVVKGIEPKDQVEAMLAAQMAAVLGNLETNAPAVQGSRGAGLDRVPLPRRARWSAEG